MPIYMLRVDQYIRQSSIRYIEAADHTAAQKVVEDMIDQGETYCFDDDPIDEYEIEVHALGKVPEDYRKKVEPWD